ncbi:hypothetical protein PRIC2_012302 [Phytophthora ramorum]
MLAAAMLVVTTSGHGYLTDPAVTFLSSSTDNTQFIATIESSASGFSGTFSGSPADNTAAFTTAFASSSYTSLKDLITGLATVTVTDATLTCGSCDPDETAQALPAEYVEWSHSSTEGFTSSHEGPCEYNHFDAQYNHCYCHRQLRLVVDNFNFHHNDDCSNDGLDVYQLYNNHDSTVDVNHHHHNDDCPNGGLDVYQLYNNHDSTVDVNHHHHQFDRLRGDGDYWKHRVSFKPVGIDTFHGLHHHRWLANGIDYQLVDRHVAGTMAEHVHHRQQRSPSHDWHSISWPRHHWRRLGQQFLWWRQQLRLPSLRSYP